MELTKKERKKVYLKAAKFFIKKRDIGRRCTGFCDFIGNLPDKYWNCKSYTEYQLFKPRKFNLYWFKHDKENMNARINALLLAAEMCKD